MEKEEFLKICSLCNISVTGEEAEQLRKEIGKILKHMESLGVFEEESEQKTTTLPLREDSALPSDPAHIRTQFPFSLDRKLKVPRGLK